MLSALFGGKGCEFVSGWAFFFFALAPLRNKRMLLPALRGNQVSGEDLSESMCCA